MHAYYVFVRKFMCDEEQMHLFTLSHMHACFCEKTSRQADEQRKRESRTTKNNSVHCNWHLPSVNTCGNQILLELHQVQAFSASPICRNSVLQNVQSTALLSVKVCNFFSSGSEAISGDVLAPCEGIWK